MTTVKRTRWLIALTVLALVGVGVTLFTYDEMVKGKIGEKYFVGAIYDLTGSLSYMGQASLEGAQLAVDEVNDNGGINGKVLELKIENGNTQAGATISAFQNMIARYHVPVVIGFNSSTPAMQTAPLAERARVVLFSSGAATPHLTSQGYRYVFRNRLSGGVEASELARLAYNKLWFRRGAILAIKNDYGQSYADAFENTFKQELNGTIVARNAFMQDQTDFKSQLAVLEAEKPEFIYLASHAPEAGAILRQAKERCFEARWLASNAVEAPMLFNLAQGGAEGLLLSVAQHDPTAADAAMFTIAYKQRYGKDPDMFAAHAYDSVMILVSVINEHGYDAEAIKKGLHEIKNYPGVSGVTTFDANGDVSKSVAFRIAKGGKFDIFDPSALGADGLPSVQCSDFSTNAE